MNMMSERPVTRRNFMFSAGAAAAGVLLAACRGRPTVTPETVQPTVVPTTSPEAAAATPVVTFEPPEPVQETIPVPEAGSLEQIVAGRPLATATIPLTPREPVLLPTMEAVERYIQSAPRPALSEEQLQKLGFLPDFSGTGIISDLPDGGKGFRCGNLQIMTDRDLVRGRGLFEYEGQSPDGWYLAPKQSRSDAVASINALGAQTGANILGISLDEFGERLAEDKGTVCMLEDARGNPIGYVDLRLPIVYRECNESFSSDGANGLDIRISDEGTAVRISVTEGRLGLEAINTVIPKFHQSPFQGTPCLPEALVLVSEKSFRREDLKENFPPNGREIMDATGIPDLYNPVFFWLGGSDPDGTVRQLPQSFGGLPEFYQSVTWVNPKITVPLVEPTERF